jgi:DNA-binding NtrC family response regulator
LNAATILVPRRSVRAETPGAVRDSLPFSRFGAHEETEMSADERPTARPLPRRVLVVEDLEDSRESLRELLELALSIEVDAAEDGVRALERLAAREYGVVITDLRMPRANGMWLLREIRDRELSCRVIVVTGHGSVKEAVEAMKLGAFDFLTKPFDPQQLIVLVDRALREGAGG